MSKKFTSFLVLAALLLAVPTHAQFAKKQSKAQVSAFKTNILKPADLAKAKDAKMKADAKFEGQAFRGFAAKGNYLQASLDKIQEDKAILQKQMEQNLEALNGPLKVKQRQFAPVEMQLARFLSQDAAKMRVARVEIKSKAQAPSDPTKASVTLTAEDVWGDGTGYQLLLDADATAYGTIIPEQGGLTTKEQGSASAETYAAFEYKIPVDADGALTTTNIISDNSVTIEVPAGTYDYVIANPTPGDRVWIASGSNGRGDDYVLEAGKSYEFKVYLKGQNDNVDILIDGEGPAGPEVVEVPAGVEAVEYVMSYTTGSTPVKVAIDGNDVYFQGMSKYIPTAWVKGVKNGNNVTFAGSQFMGEYSGMESYFFYTGPATFVYDATADTYSATGQIFGVIGGQYYDGNYTNPVLSRVVEKAATPANPSITALSNGQYGWYITFNVPLEDINGDPLLSSKLYYEIFTDVNEVVSPLIFTPATHTKLTEDMAIIPYGFSDNYDFSSTQIFLNDLYSADWNKIGIKAIYNGGGETNATEIQWYTIKPYGEAVAETADPIDAVPYVNALTSAELFADFGVIDSNNDASTWTFDASYGTSYKWNSANAANDWLISPAIKLEAGKKYHFAIDAKASGASFPEKFEVKLGTEAKASALTQSVLDEVTVTSTAFVTYENFNVSVAATGYYHFGIHATSDADQFRLAVANFLVEAGVEAAAPAAVTDFALAQTEGKLETVVSFKAPTKTVGGDDLADLTKIDILRNGVVIKSLTEGVTPGAELSYVDNDEALTIGTYTYQVIPYNAAGNGEKSEEKSIFLSVALDVPHTFDFSQNLLDQFNVIDNNGDNKTWIWSESNGAYYPYHGSNAADDYLITLPFNLKAGKNYNIIVTAKNSGSYAEKFEVKAGKEATVEGLNISVIEPTELTGGAYNEYEGILSPAEDGAYFIAIHAISDPDKLNLSVKALAVELAPEATAPAAIADFAATPGAEGALEANLAFTAPAKAINGDALTGTVDVKIYRDNVLVNTLTDVAVGAAKTWKDTDVENGKTYTYYLVASNASGDGLKSEKKSVFVGEDELGDIEELNVTGITANTISFSWSEVAGANGGYVNTANVKYAVVSAHVETVWIFQELIIDGILGSVTGETSSTFDYAVDEGDQGYKYFGVVALKADADLPAVGDELAGAYTWALTGAPYDLPLIEGFTGSVLHYVWDSNAFLGISEEDTDGDGVALDMMTEEPGVVYLQSGKVNIKGTSNPTIVFNAKSPNVSKLFVYASKDGGDETLVSTIDLTEDYESYKVSLANFTDATRYVQFSFVAQLATPYTANAEGTAIADKGDYITMDDIRVMDLYEYNLKVAVKAPKSVVAGQKAKIAVAVTNDGENAAKDYVVTVKAGEKLLASVFADDELASFATDVFDVDFETSIFDEAGDVTLTATVDYENELYPDDNTAETLITVMESTAAAPENFTAANGADGVDLAWNTPSSSTSETTENFSAYENGANDTGLVGDWTLVNNNGAPKGSMFKDLALANDGLDKAWEVLKPSEYGIDNSQFVGPNGSLDEAYLVSAYNLEGQSYPDNDDWLISPELPGVAQEISFSIGALSVEYGPSSYEVLVSTTDNQIESFTKVAEETLTAAGWASKTVELPAGTKFFAIRNNTPGDGAMCVMLGDITYLVGGSLPVAYNIFYEGEKIASVEGDKTTYTVAAEKVEDGERTFAITAVYATGAESKPVVVKIKVEKGTDAISEIIANGKAVDVYSLDGKLVRGQAKSLNGLKGVYVINGKAVIVK